MALLEVLFFTTLIKILGNKKYLFCFQIPEIFPVKTYIILLDSRKPKTVWIKITTFFK